MQAREGKWDAQTMHLLSFAISVDITLKGSVQSGGGERQLGGDIPLPPSVLIPAR